MNKFIKTFLMILAIIFSIPILILLFLFLLIALYDVVLFTLNGFDLNYLEIDKCMDHGHSWNYKEEKCNE